VGDGEQSGVGSDLGGAKIYHHASDTGRRCARFFRLVGDRPTRKLFDAGVALPIEDEVIPVHLEAVAMNLLADQFPEGERLYMRRLFAVAAAVVFEENGYRVPEGLAELAGVEPGEGKRSYDPTEGVEEAEPDHSG
jgi:hypothetical protein